MEAAAGCVAAVSACISPERLLFYGSWGVFLHPHVDTATISSPGAFFSSQVLIPQISLVKLRKDCGVRDQRPWESNNRKDSVPLVYMSL